MPAAAARKPTLDDRWVLDGSLDAEGGSVVVDVCRFFLDHQQGRAGGRHRPHVNVVVELADLEAGRGGPGGGRTRR